MNILEFKQNFRGGARKNKFVVSIPRLGDKFNKYLVQSTEIPAFTIEPISAYSLAGEIKVAGKRTVNDWTVSIILDEDYVNGINILENWQMKAREVMSAEGSNNAHVGSEQYKYDATVTQLDQRGNAIATYVLEGIWPSEIGARSYDYSDDGIVTCDVTFSVDDVRHVDATNIAMDLLQKGSSFLSGGII